MRAAALLRATVLVGLISASCAGQPARPQPSPGARQGGTIVVAAEQYPQCLNPINQCANSSWLSWVVTAQVLPKAMAIDEHGNFVATPLLTEAPTTQNGGIKENPFTLTYRINPQAVWDDGSPITSADFEFSWQAWLKTTGSLSTAGYDKITKIDASDPKTAVITFSENFADWWDLFGGNQGFVIKKSSFPGGVDLKDAMTTDIPFSGWYWKLQSFTRQQIVLVRNDKFWGKPALLDQVTVVPRQDSSTEVNSLLSGEVAAIYPQPTADMPRRLRGNSQVEFTVAAGSTYEGLWMNTTVPPLDDPRVREAIAWATDREAVISAIVRPIDPKAKPLNCAGWVPTIGEWCNERDFARFRYDPQKAKQILQEAGWTPGGDGIFVKGGKRLAIEFTTTAGNKGREDTQALLKEKWKAAGIDLVVKNYAAPSPIFTGILPKLNFMLAEYANVASPDPSVNTLYPCDQVPSEANEYSGQNYTAYCDKETDALVRRSDQELDPAARRDLIHAIGAKIGKDVPWLPLYQKPLIVAWRKDKIGGPIDRYTASSYSAFYGMNEWYLAS